MRYGAEMRRPRLGPRRIIDWNKICGAETCATNVTACHKFCHSAEVVFFDGFAGFGDDLGLALDIGVLDMAHAVTQ